MAAELSATVREPFIGPRPFTRAEQSLFFGREREARELAALIVAHQAVLLYSQSGAGKSSLLAAGTIPLLEKRGAEVLGPARVGGGVVLPGGNTYMSRALMSLWVDPEEPFLGQDFSGFLALRPRKANGLRVVVFDQFEELFTTSPERWQDRGPFLEQIGQALADDPGLRVVFAMREEYLANLDPLVHALPERLRTRYRLERLKPDAAVSCVEGPLAGTTRHFKPGAAQALVRNLLKVPMKAGEVTVEVEGEVIEPVHLQIVCKRLWESLPEDVHEIDEGFLAEFGDVDEALSSYYESCIAAVVQKTGMREGELRAWFSDVLITPDGTRGTVYRDKETSGGIQNAVLDELEALHVMRAELRGGARWYELTHDRLIGPVRSSNEAWRRKHEVADVFGTALEARAREWEKSGSQVAALLEGQGLDEAQAWHASLVQGGGEPSPVVLAFLERSQSVERKRDKARARRKVWLLMTVCAVLGLALSSSVYYALKAERIRMIERGDHARELASLRGGQFQALATGIRAVAQDLLDGGEPPAEAVEGLRVALGAMGDAVYLRDSTERTAWMDLAPDGEHAATLCGERLVLWNTTSGEALRAFWPLPNEAWTAAHFSPDGAWIVAQSGPKVPRGSRALNEPNAPYAQSVQQRPPPTEPEEVLSRTIRIGLETGEQEETIVEAREAAQPTAMSRDGRRALLLVRGPGGEERWMLVGPGVEPPSGAPIATNASEAGIVIFSPLGNWLLLEVMDDRGTSICIHDARTGELRARLQSPDERSPVIRFSGDDELLVLVPSDVPRDRAWGAAAWDPATGRRVFSLAQDESADMSYAYSVGITPDRSRIVVVGQRAAWDSEVVLVFDGKTGALLLRRASSQSQLGDLESSGGIYSILADETMRVKAWNPITDEDLVLSPPIKSEIVQLVVARGLTKTAVLDEEGIARVWRAAAAPVDLAALSSRALLGLAVVRLARQPECEEIRKEFDWKALRAAAGIPAK